MDFALTNLKKLRLSPYQLVANHLTTQPSRRFGVLIKAQWDQSGIGYADLHSMQAFGYPSIEQQLKDFAQGLLPEPLQIALHLSHQDALARGKSKSIFDGLQLPRSHYLFSSILSGAEFNAQILKKIADKGFSAIKVKVSASGAELPILRAHLPVLKELNLRLRLDANSQLSTALFTEYESLFLNWDLLEIFEDPLPASDPHWSRSPLPLAYDFERLQPTPQAGPRFVVLKPALQVEPPTSTTLAYNLAYVTHCMDHPLGQWAAAALAARKWPDRIHGVNPWEWQDQDGRTWETSAKSWPQGTGFGFDAHLECLAWQNFRFK